MCGEQDLVQAGAGVGVGAAEAARSGDQFLGQDPYFGVGLLRSPPEHSECLLGGVPVRDVEGTDIPGRHTVTAVWMSRPVPLPEHRP